MPPPASSTDWQAVQWSRPARPGPPSELAGAGYLPPNPNVGYSAVLMSKAEEMFLTGVAPYPVERTLLTTGLVESGMKSLAAGSGWRRRT